MKKNSIGSLIICFLLVFTFAAILYNNDILDELTLPKTQNKDETVLIDKSQLDTQIYYQYGTYDETNQRILRIIGAFKGVKLTDITKAEFTYCIAKTEVLAKTTYERVKTSPTKFVKNLEVSGQVVSAESLGYDYLGYYIVQQDPVGMWINATMEITYKDNSTSSTDKISQILLDKSMMGSQLYYQVGILANNEKVLRIIGAFKGVRLTDIKKIELKYAIDTSESNVALKPKTTVLLNNYVEQIEVLGQVVSAESLGYDYLGLYIIETNPIGMWVNTTMIITLIDNQVLSITKNVLI